jgi:hypothetical protein
MRRSESQAVGMYINSEISNEKIELTTKDAVSKRQSCSFSSVSSGALMRNTPKPVK